MIRREPGLRLGRRAFLGSLLAGAPLLLSRPLSARTLSAGVPDAGRIDFDILRQGSSIGRHSLRFRREGPLLKVDIEIDIDISLAFIPIFSYRHRNSEVWKADRLVSLETETDDDGERHRVSAWAVPEGLRVEGTGGSFLAPADIVPTSYWNERTLSQTALLDTQGGTVMEVLVEPAGRETLASGRDARRYRISGDLEVELWYSAAGEWLKIAFEARGAEISYARLTGGTQSGTAG